MQTAGQQIVFTGRGQVQVVEFPIEAPGVHEILVQTECSLISAGTELTNLLGELSAFQGYPVYPGYSNVGVVIQAGARVQAPAVGQRIISMGRHASHFKLDLAPDRANGPQYWGAVPPAVSSAEASFAILGSVALHSVRKAQLQMGEAVAIVGAGVVGQLIAQCAYWSGCQPVILLDLCPSRLAIARQWGVDATIHLELVDPVTTMLKLTGGRGADVVFECTRSAQTLPLMMQLAGQSSRIAIVGSLPGEVAIDPFTDLQRKEIQLIGCFQPAAPLQEHAYFPWTQRRNRQVFLDLMANQKLRVGHLLTHRLPFTRAPEAYAMIQRGGNDWLGVVFEW